MPLPIETARLRLRPVQLEDATDLFEVFGSPTVMRYIGSGKTQADVDDTRAMIRRRIRYQEQHGFSMWAMVVKASGKTIGDCGLQYLDGGPEVEVGYRLAESAWNNGYATEGARASVGFGFDELKLKKIVAIAQPQHIASQRVMEKIPMRCVGEAVHYGTRVVRFEITRAMPRP